MALGNNIQPLSVEQCFPRVKVKKRTWTELDVQCAHSLGCEPQPFQEQSQEVGSLWNDMGGGEGSGSGRTLLFLLPA